MNVQKSKKDLINNIFIDEEKNRRTDTKIIKEVLHNLPELAKHQNFFSRNFGFSIPKSLQIMACKLAAIFTINLTEHNLAKILHILCTSRDPDNCYKQLSTLSKYLLAKESKVFKIDNSDQKVDFKTSTSKNRDINDILKVTDFILNTTETGYFREVINETRTGVYKNSYYTNYNTNNLFNNDIEVFNDEHFTFWSGKTHVVSGMIALTPIQQEYNYEVYLDSVICAILKLGKIIINEPKNNISREEEANAIDTYDGLSTILKKLCPKNNISREEAIEFYQNKNLKLELSAKLEKEKDWKNYIIEPVLIHDKLNNHCFVHLEFGTKEAFDKKPPKYMFHFNGNGESSDIRLNTGIEFTKTIDTIQVLIDYPNKGINHILNPEVSAYKTSIKGSINPHLVAYNHYCKKHDNNFVLEMYAHSYGNLAGVQFIKRIQEKHSNRKILFIGSGTPASLVDVAKSYVGKWGTFADYIKLLNRSDVFDVLSQFKENVKAIIFNNTPDSVIKQSAQIQKHFKFIPTTKRDIIDKTIETYINAWSNVKLMSKVPTEEDMKNINFVVVKDDNGTITFYVKDYVEDIVESKRTDEDIDFCSKLTNITTDEDLNQLVKANQSYFTLIKRHTTNKKITTGIEVCENITVIPLCDIGLNHGKPFDRTTRLVRGDEYLFWLPKYFKKKYGEMQG